MIPIFASAEIVTIDVTIKAVDATGRTVTATRRDKTLTLDVSRKAEVIINGEAGELAALGNGQTAKIDYETNLEIITKIDATGKALPAPELLVLREINTLGGGAGLAFSPDGLTIYWHVKTDDELWIWTARRADPEALFEDKKQLMPGADPTVTGDGLEMVLRQGKHLCSTKRDTVDDSFKRPRVIAELSEFGILSAPCISENGLTLYVDQTKNDTQWISVATRETRDSKWSEPLRLTLEDHSLAFPSITSDARMLFCVRTDIDRKERCNFVLFSRHGLEDPFSFSGFVDFPELRQGGIFPRYCTATSELFFSGISSGNHLDLMVVKNFSPTTMVRKDSLPVASPTTNLEGTWIAVDEESDGRLMKPADLKSAMKTLQIQNGLFTLSWSGKTMRGKVNVMPDELPPAIDLSGELNGKATVLLAIYELKGDIMRFCYRPQIVNVKEAERPAEFETTAESDSVCITYKRQK
jgi:uncharacterized protein (TIGR03067 family)